MIMKCPRNAAATPLEFAAAQIADDRRAALHVVDKAILDLNQSPFCRNEVAVARANYLRRTEPLRRGRRLFIRQNHQHEVATAQASMLAAALVVARRQRSEMLVVELDRLWRLVQGHPQNARSAGTSQ